MDVVAAVVTMTRQLKITVVVDWSELSSEILELILSRLAPIDHLKFGWVCRSWRSARLARSGSTMTPMPPQLPWLMIHSYPSNHRCFLNTSDGKRYKFELPELCGYSCVGSQGNWLIMRSHNRAFLYNPFTIRKFVLPPLRGFVQVIVASSEPDAVDFVVVAFNEESSCFYVFRHGFKRWSAHNYATGGGGLVRQALATGGKFFALTSGGRLAHIDLDRVPPLVIVSQAGRVKFDRSREHAYLVESSGELLAVIEACTCGSSWTVTTIAMFRILKLDLTTSLWVEEDLGVALADRVLFLGPQGSASVVAREVGIPGGRIYTAGNESPGMFDVLHGGGGHGGRESVCCVHGWRKSNWVSPGLIYRDREPEVQAQLCCVSFTHCFLLFLVVLHVLLLFRHFHGGRNTSQD